MQLDLLRNDQFLAIFQGLCLCGPNVFKSDALNVVLNSFVARLGEENKQPDDETIKFD